MLMSSGSVSSHAGPRPVDNGHGALRAEQDVVCPDVGVDEGVAGQGRQSSIGRRAEFVEVSCGPRVKIGGGIRRDAGPAFEVLGE
jgi:hypothetical protein